MKRYHITFWLLFGGLLLALWSGPALAQIGGKTASDGPFLIDGAEDMNLRSETLGRDWISDFVQNQKVLTWARLSISGLTLAEGQSTVGTLKATVPEKFGSVHGGFGVPMPAQPGASTADSPGDITSFNFLNFLACHDLSGLPGQKFQVLLECYPGNPDGTYPTVFWDYTPAADGTFQWINIELAEPTGILNNPANKTIGELLAKTRFLYFLIFASPVSADTTLILWMDDLQLTTAAIQPPQNGTAYWTCYE